MARFPEPLLLAVAALAALAACSPDYSGIRSWATTASQVVATAPASASETPSATALRETATAHLDALSRLAMDGLLRHTSDPLSAQAAALGGADTDDGRAAQAIGALLLRASEELWRAPQLRRMIAEGDPAFQRIVEQLQATERRAEEAEAEALQLSESEGAVGHDADRLRDPAVRTLLREAALFRERIAAQRSAARRLRHDALRRIAEAHRAFAEQPDELSRAEVVRSAYEAEAMLRRALTAHAP